MGEAKRRKQLGLMPTVYPFEAELDAGGAVRLVRGPDDDALNQLIVDELVGSQTGGAAWASEYRTALLLSGKYGKTVATAEDVDAMPVAPLRRITGELAMGPVGAQEGQVTIPVEGGVIRLRGQQHSVDGTRWDTFTPPRDPQQFMAILRNNPAFDLTGESIGQLTAEHWQAGRMDIDPDPANELLEAVEAVVTEWHGETGKLWASLHRERMEDNAAPIPQARRSTFDLRHPAPLQNPLSGIFAIRGGAEFIPIMEADAYTLDGETWHSYADPDAEVDSSSLPAELANIFDMEMVGATVYADGRVELGDDVPAEHTERIQAELREATGAGDADAWADWTLQMLSETYGDELVDVLDDQALPVPVAVRLDIPKDALGDPDPLSQTFMESEVTFDGTQWHDLFDDLPPELAAFAAPAPEDNEGENQLN